MINAKVGESSSIVDAHKKILAERGISVETALAAGIRSASAREAKAILGFDPRSGGVLIPYIHPITSAIRTFRYRPDTPFSIDGKTTGKYLSPRGVGALIYFPPNIGARLKEVAEPVLVTEGELKSLAATERGLLCVALPGVWGWRSRGANGQSGPVADLDLIDARGRAFTIVFDSDVALNSQVERARHSLGKEIYRRGAAVVLAINLPAPDGVKIGLDDFLVAQGTDALFNLEAVELPPTDLPPFSEPLSAMLSAPEEPLEWGIEGIRPLGASGFSIAPPKTIKSWDMVAEAYCLSTGTPLYGRFNVPRRRRVWVVEEEDPRRRIKRRLHRTIAAHGGIVPADEFFRISIKKGLRLDVAAWREAIEYEVKTFRPEFVYLDVFSRLHAQDINDTKAMSEIVMFLDQLNRDYGAAFIILHHTRKNGAGGDLYDEILGSRALGGFSESTVFFSKTKEKSIVKVEVSLKDEPEDGSLEEKFMIRLSDTEDGQGTKIEYLGPPPEIAAANELQEKIMSALKAAADWQTVKQVAEALKVSKPTAREILNRLVDLKMAEKESRGQAFAYRARKPETPENGEIFQ